MGDHFHLPYAIIAKSTRNAPVMGRTANSPRTMWKMLANSITRVRHAAANVVSCGRILSRAGRISPTAPNNSEMPMKRTNSSGTDVAQNIVGAIS
jgi:hypothetical protein